MAFFRLGLAGCDQEAHILVCLDRICPNISLLLRPAGNRIQLIFVSHLAILGVHPQDRWNADRGSRAAHRAYQRSLLRNCWGGDRLALL
jgi:hypothetical protein